MNRRQAIVTDTPIYGRAKHSQSTPSASERPVTYDHDGDVVMAEVFQEWDKTKDKEKTIRKLAARLETHRAKIEMN